MASQAPVAEPDPLSLNPTSRHDYLRPPHSCPCPFRSAARRLRSQAGRHGRKETHRRFLADRRRKRMAHRQHRVDQGRGGTPRHHAAVRRCAAEAGEPDQGAAFLHCAGRRCDRVLAGGRDRLGTGAQGNQAGGHPGGAVGPRGEGLGGRSLCHLHRLRFCRGRPSRRPLAGGEDGRQGRDCRARRHARFGAGDRSQAWLRRGDRGACRHADHQVAERRLHPREGQGGHGNVSQVARRSADHGAVRAQ